MAAQIIDGKAVSAKVKEEVRQEIEREGLDVGLAVVIVGDDPASRVYVNNKKKACEVCGIKSYEYALPAETTEEQLMELIDALNADSKVNGILVQLPLPKHLNEEAVIARISPLKDVDAFSASNVGKIMIGNYAFLPCTPAGCMELIHSTGVDVSGKECVVIGRTAWSWAEAISWESPWRCCSSTGTQPSPSATPTPRTSRKSAHALISLLQR